MPSPPSDAPTRAATSAGYLTDLAQNSGDQLLAFYRQSAETFYDAAFTWAETMLRFSPVKRPPSIAQESLTRLTATAFDLTEKTLKVQRELVAAALARLKEPAAT